MGLNCCKLMAVLSLRNASVDKQRKQFLEKWNFLLRKYAEDIVEMTTKDLKYHVNSVDKAVAQYEITDSNFEILGKMLSNGKIFLGSKSQFINKLYCFLILGNCFCHPISSNHHCD